MLIPVSLIYASILHQYLYQAYPSFVWIYVQLDTLPLEALEEHVDMMADTLAHGRMHASAGKSSLSQSLSLSLTCIMCLIPSASQLPTEYELNPAS